MLREITTTEEYSELIKYFDAYHFSQSELFFQVRKATGVPVRAFAYFKISDANNQEILAMFQVLENRLLRGKNVLIIPFGPVLRIGVTIEDIQTMIKEILSVYTSQTTTKPIFIQIDPFSMIEENNTEYKNLLDQPTSFSKPYRDFRHADGTIYVELSQTPDELYENFRKDMRYNIRKAEKDNMLTFAISRQQESFELFWNLYEQTQQKKGFRDQRKGIYKGFFDNGSAFIYEARSTEDHQLVACVFCVEFKEQGTLITFLSATTHDGNKLKAPTLLRWNLIKLAHEAGYRKLDFFSMEKDLSGPSAFKLGFNGKVVWYNEPRDYVVDRANYRIAKLYDTIKKILPR